ncbi:MAG: hypothetical protein KGJ62_15140 [Armatimonadetes bacterium]|nr:hypothetical protein [Armatimonadota bacterium]MDE2206281.1 hypothetical protein [Armatimonadota bacterium]
MIQHRTSKQPIEPEAADRPELVTAIITALLQGATRRTAAAAAGINEAALQSMLRHNPCLEAELAQAEAQCETRCAAAVMEAVEKGDWRAALALLARRDPAAWQERRQIDVRKLTDLQIVALLEADAEAGSEPQGTGGEPGGE